MDELHEAEEWDAIDGAFATRPDTSHVRAARFLNASGDLPAAVILIGLAAHL